MKKASLLFFSIFLLFVSPLVFSQDQKFSFGNMYFEVSPKILEDGSITDINIGYRYTEKYAGDLRLRFSKESKNEEIELDEVKDSLNTVNNSNTEVYLLPFEYYFVVNTTIEARAGIGAYYSY
jgi:hypothetical protein